MKTYESLNTIYNNFKNVKYVLKTDDDMIVNAQFIKTILKLLNAFNYDYIGEFISTRPHFSNYHFEKVEKHESKRIIKIEETTYSPGRFYILKKDMIK